MGCHAFIIENFKLSLLEYIHTIRIYYGIRLEFMILYVAELGAGLVFWVCVMGKLKRIYMVFKHLFPISPVVLTSTISHKESYNLCRDWEIVRSHAA